MSSKYKDKYIATEETWSSLCVYTTNVNIITRASLHVNQSLAILSMLSAMFILTSLPRVVASKLLEAESLKLCNWDSALMRDNLT